MSTNTFGVFPTIFIYEYKQNKSTQKSIVFKSFQIQIHFDPNLQSTAKFLKKASVATMGD